MPSVSKRVAAVATRETMSLASSILEPFSSKAAGEIPLVPSAAVHESESTGARDRRRKRNRLDSPIDPESSTNKTVSNSASFARSIATSIGMRHSFAMRLRAPDWAIRCASESSEAGG